MTQTVPELTHDAFLGGRLTLSQPVSGYRAGVDPVFLAAAVPAKPTQSVLELGCGAGAASLCLGLRVPGLRLAGLERQALYADLAEHNATQNQIALTVHHGDLAQMPDTLRSVSFDHVIMNPPYFRRDRGTASPDTTREGALGEDTPLSTWLDQATRRLSPGGHITLIQHAERLPEVLGAIDSRLGAVVVKPLCPRIGRAASLVIVQARKGARGAFRLAAPLILHKGAAHTMDRDHYTPDVAAILRRGAALTLD
ncbi:methyltransferase [Aliiroseovarius sediminis]|uniref:tRNA1(Val) (adenine(37)-N6)-methyltransferase n=1 Tax=Aliiroseovarius sediminis TaxID=2925839 RepID=UPI001F56ABB1|nr:methyltransferase [Aliiroseovarius sediminis]MCI2395432.1 methyltransferase [Aliiroseovarius sediminis]